MTFTNPFRTLEGRLGAKAAKNGQLTTELRAQKRAFGAKASKDVWTWAKGLLETKGMCLLIILFVRFENFIYLFSRRKSCFCCGCHDWYGLTEQESTNFFLC